jgi:hypothetical protein
LVRKSFPGFVGGEYALAVEFHDSLSAMAGQGSEAAMR